MFYEAELNIYYLFTLVDGEATIEENGKFIQLCNQKEFDFANRTALIKECLDIVGDDDRLREEKIKKEIKNIVETYFWLPDKQRILWNVVNLAFTDAELAPSEKRIIDFLAKQFEIPQEIYDDMFDVAQTMLALVNEEQRLKAFPDEDNKEKIEAIKSKINDLYNYVTDLVEMADVK